MSRSPALLRHNEPEISETLTKALRTRMSILTSTEVKGVSEVGEVKEVTIVDEKGAEKTIKTESLLIAAGLRGNADLLKTEKTGVRSDDRGYIQVNNFYETSKPRIWAFGDATGRAMFKHVANWEAELVWNTFDHGHRRTLDYDKIPYAIFSWPEVGGVGITEEETIRRRLNYLVSVYPYEDTAYGSAMGDKEGFVKLLVEEKTYKILGCHIVGPQAPILIQEVIIAMNAGDGSVYPLIDSMHIHPALSEVVQRAVWHLHKPKHNQT